MKLLGQLESTDWGCFVSAWNDENNKETHWCLICERTSADSFDIVIVNRNLWTEGLDYHPSTPAQTKQKFKTCMRFTDVNDLSLCFM